MTTRYRVELVPVSSQTHPVQALRRFLKCAIRSYGLRAVAVEEVAEAAAPTPAAPEAAPGPAWTGWVRVAPGEPWLPIVSGADRDQVEQRLRRFAPADSEQVVLEAGGSGSAPGPT